MTVPHDGPCAVEVGGLAKWRRRNTLLCTGFWLVAGQSPRCGGRRSRDVIRPFATGDQGWRSVSRPCGQSPGCRRRAVRSLLPPRRHRRPVQPHVCWADPDKEQVGRRDAELHRGGQHGRGVTVSRAEGRSGAGLGSPARSTVAMVDMKTGTIAAISSIQGPIATRHRPASSPRW
jgi:hypothetical protein